MQKNVTAPCKIREWRRTDANELALALNNKKIHDNLRDGLPFPYTEKDASDYIEAMLGEKADNVFAYAICVGDKAIGSIGVFRCGNIHRRTAEMGYYLAEGYWGKGIATEAVKMTCKAVFSSSDIIRIFAEPFSKNLASCRVLEKAGFICEGILRKNAVKNGEILDMKMYSLINPNYGE